MSPMAQCLAPSTFAPIIKWCGMNGCLTGGISLSSPPPMVVPRGCYPSLGHSQKQCSQLGWRSLHGAAETIMVTAGRTLEWEEKQDPEPSLPLPPPEKSRIGSLLSTHKAWVQTCTPPQEEPEVSSRETEAGMQKFKQGSLIWGRKVITDY